MPTNVHKFYILTRQPSPVGETSTTTTTRYKISRGESKPGTTTTLKYNSKTDLVEREERKSQKIKLNPGDIKEEEVIGGTVRWTITANGTEHTVADIITLRELEILKAFPTGLTAYNAISANIAYTSAPEDLAYNSITPYEITFDMDDFINMISASDKTQLSHLSELIYQMTDAEKAKVAVDGWEGVTRINYIDTFARANLPSGVTL